MMERSLIIGNSTKLMSNHRPNFDHLAKNDSISVGCTKACTASSLVDRI